MSHLHETAITPGSTEQTSSHQSQINLHFLLGYRHFEALNHENH